MTRVKPVFKEVWTILLINASIEISFPIRIVVSGHQVGRGFSA